MHLMNDLLADVGKVSVKMQNPKAIILDVPDWMETLLTAVFNARSCLTPHLSAFVNQFDTSTFKWRNIKLSTYRNAGTIDAWLNAGQRTPPEQTVNAKS